MTEENARERNAANDAGCGSRNAAGGGNGAGARAADEKTQDGTGAVQSSAADGVRRMVAETFLDIREGLLAGTVGPLPRIAVTGPGSEHGEENVLAGAVAAARAGGVKVLYIGTLDAHEPNVMRVPAATPDEAHAAMERLLETGEADGAVTMHYPFPIGVATVGRLKAPATGRDIFLATTTGTADTDRAAAMVKGAVYGVAAAKCCGVADPSVGILNLDGARAAEAALKKLAAGGWHVRFGASARADGGCVLRGNDVLTGGCDVLVCDSLTGNLLAKLLSAFTSGGAYETTGCGYGPGIGPGFARIVGIVSRASGAPVIAGAIGYAAQMVRADLPAAAARELAAAEKAGLAAVTARAKPAAGTAAPAVSAPPKEVVTAQIAGVEIMDLDAAVQKLWAAGVYAESGMGCTGPVIRVSEEKLAAARDILRKAEYISD